MKRFLIVPAVWTLFNFAIGSNAQNVPLAEVATRAVERSKLTQADGTPFHLKVTIVESTNPDSDYKAEVEEYWVSSQKLRRTISSPGFSQTLIVNGDKISDNSKGAYLPWWLNDLMTAIVDPLPMLDRLKGINAVMQRPSGSEHSSSCARLQTKVGVPPAENSAFVVLCFEGSHGLLKSAITPGYDAEFEDYRDFKNKRVARRLVLDPEPGTTIEAKVIELTELTNIDESLFAVPQATPPTERMARIVVSEATARTLFLDTPDIVWPSVRSGKTSGVLSMYISVDRSGRVRETWPLNSDNAGLDDAARQQVMKWKFKPAKTHDVPIQIETVLTFAFNSKVGNPIPILSDVEARKLATNVVEPEFPPGTVKGTEVKVQIGVSLDGSVNGVGNPYNMPTPLFMAAYSAVSQWHFHPYLRDGKPDLFGADIVFRVH
jgi:TonB family protein